MVGNDIIDINETRMKSNWKRKGFAQKVFNLEEQAAIDSSSDPFLTVWSIWSMKESAYKALLQNGAERFFNPSKLSCEILSSEKGRVCINGLEFMTQTKVNSEYIHTTASLKDSNTIEKNIFYLDKNDSSFQSEVTHQKLLQYIGEKNQLERAKLKIKKSTSNVPWISYKDRKLNISFSLSHHGNYGAFTILNN